MTSELELIYRDEHMVAINKPNGLLVHRSPIANDAKEFAVQLLRDQIGQRVSPVHRLDRKTSGVLLFAFDSTITKQLQSQFTEGTISKNYIAIVRGYFPEKITVEHPLINDKGNKQEALTQFQLIAQSELDLPFGKHKTSRYSLIEAQPKTGRMHQIRKHLNHLRHPIIGDRPHGCNKQNRLFKERWAFTRMLLHAQSLTLEHPVTKQIIQLEAQVPKEFTRMQEILGL